ncbi:MAG: site-specific DNA-methyltransferase, partial [Candidatus Moeniiplasma glomeromycotorum]|nr:site-specific DNA-methyltransferase [Candidatus Moeniiplasma glomeromycotorum]
KNKTLIVSDYEKIKYEWVNSNDYRVSEVRLLKEIEKIGDNSSDSLIICGDSLNALTSLTKIPEYRKKYVNKVKLIYIDPPFNTGQMFTNYDDQLEHSVWLTMMRDRVLKAYELLSDDGSLWVHLDDTELYHFKIVLDEIFGKENFISSVIWEKMYLLKEDAKQFSQGHDTILIYSKDKEKWKPNFLEKKLNLGDFKFQDEKGRHYKRVTLRKTGSNSARADRPNMFYPITAPNGEIVYPIRRSQDVEDEGCWRWGMLTYEERKNEIDWVKGKNGWQPFVRQYADETEKKPPSSIWHYSEVGSSATAKKEIKKLFPEIEPFQTPKPERLLQRIIEIATNEGDIVLDYFAGSGTTAAVAQKLKRKWVIVEKNEDTVNIFVVPRLKKVVSGEDKGGISEEVNWNGVGGFTYFSVEKFMFEVHSGIICLAENVLNGKLAKLVATQLEYDYQPENEYFCGKKGDVLLAVVEGMLTDGLLNFLLNSKDENNFLEIAALAVDPELNDKNYNNVKIGRIPNNILRHYARV